MFEALLDCLFSIDLNVGQKNVSVLKKPLEVADDLLWALPYFENCT